MRALDKSVGSTAPQPEGALYRLVWRWHFFAGLICLPVLVIMAVTGALYLFRDEISDSAYASRLLPPASLEQSALPLGTVVERVLATHPGALHEIGLPQEAGRSLTLVMTPQGGERSVLHVDPTDASVLGLREEASLWDVFVKKLHSGSLFGRWANIVVEIIAGWCIVLIVSGTYLWWPRGRKGGVLSVRGSPQGRTWWRDLHAVTGAIAGAVILFLALTGMPWTEIWGPQFRAVTNYFGLGMPVHVWAAVPQSTLPIDAHGEVSWTFKNAPVPASSMPQGDHSHQGHGATQAKSAMPAQWGLASPAIGIDRAVQAFREAGLENGYRLRLPSGGMGAYSALYFPPQVSGQRVVHLDQYSGRVLVDVGFADYGAVAKAVEWGVGVHQGREYGFINQLVMLFGCVAIVLLTVTSVQMWWKRRPKGKLAAPPRKEGDRLARGAIAIALVIGLAFPPLGASMLAAAALEWWWGRRTSSLTA